MTYKQKIDYLERYQQTQRKIRGDIEEIEKLRDLATDISKKINPILVDISRGDSKIEKYGIEIYALCKEIQVENENLIVQRKEIVKTINSLRDSRKKDILHARYISGYSITRLSEIYKTSKKSIHGRLNTAIKALDI